jgi:hypothetical protein
VKGIAQFFGLRYFHDTSSGEEQVIHRADWNNRTDGKLFKLYRGNDGSLTRSSKTDDVGQPSK